MNLDNILINTVLMINHTAHFPNKIIKISCVVYAENAFPQLLYKLISLPLPSNVNGFGQCGHCVPTALTETTLSHPAHSALPQSEHIVLN